MKFTSDKIRDLNFQLQDRVFKGFQCEASYSRKARDFLQNESFDQGFKLYVIEPFTSASVGLKLAEGIFSWIGAKAFEEILKAINAGGATKDWEKIIRDAVIEISAVFKGVIQAEELEKALAEVTALQKNIQEYINAPSSSFDRISYANVQCVALVENLKRFGIDGLGGYMIAQGLHFFILQERYKAKKDPGELKNITALKLDVYNSEIGAFIDSARERNRILFSNQLYYNVYIGYYCEQEGRKIALDTQDPDEAQRNFDALVLRNYQKVFEPDINKALEIVYKWFKIPTEENQIPGSR